MYYFKNLRVIIIIICVAIFYSTFVDSILAYLLYKNKNKYDYFQNNTIVDPETPPIQVYPSV